jgi:hypothetical protein
MVKTPQSTLGYAVNGQLVFMPPQRNALKNQKNEKKRRGDRNDPVKSNGSTIHRYYQLRFHPGMVALKNASRVGDLQAAYDAIINKIWNGRSRTNSSQVEYSYRLISQLKSGGAYPYSVKEFSCLVRILTAPHVENRSAIDYAAHCGQTYMVRNYIGLLVLSCCVASRNQIKKNIGTLTLTFEGWFEYLGYPSGFFNKEALRLCVLNSLNEETKRVFQSNTYTLETILASTRNLIGKAWPFDAESLVNGMVVAKTKTMTKRTRRPVLRFHDLSREDPHILLMNDAAEEPSSLYWEDTHLLMSADEEDQSDWEEGDEAVEKDEDNFLEDYDVVSIVDGGLLVTAADEELSSLIDGQQDDQIEESANSDADISGSSLSVVILNLQERENIEDESSSTDWSMLSEVSSVVTFESSMVRSFKDALISNAGTSVQPYSNLPKLAAIQEKSAKDESSSDDGFDPCFMMEGVKGARGGRSARMFKGNRRTYPNCLRRHRFKRREEIPRAHRSKRMV